jgi:bifunctional N-acetylglucosamine-1-phosphate-uridyltransferase/glucosamine-1-phosphate-acetyltransferase GlmU-like protein
LPDALTILRDDGHPIAAQKVKDSNEVLGVNSPEQLKQIAKIYVKH